MAFSDLQIKFLAKRLKSLQHQGRGSRQAEKARREAEVEVEAANRKIEALEVSFGYTLPPSPLSMIHCPQAHFVRNFIHSRHSSISTQEQLCRMQNKLRLSKQQAEDSELIASASQARSVSLEMLIVNLKWIIITFGTY